MTLKPCLTCGALTDATRCPNHQPKRKASSTARGYDWNWRRLSEHARRIQPFCTTCGATEDLTLDHSPEAWQTRAQGKPIRLDQVDVLCRSCNSRRGRARPTGEGANTQPPDPRPRLSLGLSPAQRGV